MVPPLRLAVVQFKPRKGDYAANLARIGDVLARVAALDPRPDIVQLPETALTGYFVEGGVRDLAVTTGTLARDLDRLWRARGGATATALDLVVGFYEVWDNTLYNSAMYVTVGGAAGGKVRHVHRKTFLPTYGLFDEERFVERGHDVRAFDTQWGRAAMLVCEDAWHSITGMVAALDGAQLLFVCAAAPARGIWPRADGVPGPASVARWERLIRDIAEEHGIYVALANLVGSKGGKTFGGSSMLAGPRGELRARASVWDESIVLADVDLDDLTRARADMPLLSDLRTALPRLRSMLARVERGELSAAPLPPVAFDAAIVGTGGFGSASHALVRGEGVGGALASEAGEAERAAAEPASALGRGPPRKHGDA